VAIRVSTLLQDCQFSVRVFASTGSYRNIKVCNGRLGNLNDMTQVRFSIAFKESKKEMAIGWGRA
jgi:hypothetical protein